MQLGWNLGYDTSLHLSLFSPLLSFSHSQFRGQIPGLGALHTGSLCCTYHDYV